MKSTILLLLFAGGVVIACASIEPIANLADCAEMDWFELGRSDGVLGKPSLEWQQRMGSCHSFNDQLHRSYLNGWYAGINLFCSSGHGYAFGKTGHAYYDVCPQSKEEEFVKAYQEGLKVFYLENANKEAHQQILSIESDLSEKTPEEQAVLRLKLKELEKKRTETAKEVSKIENKMGRKTL